MVLNIVTKDWDMQMASRSPQLPDPPSKRCLGIPHLEVLEVRSCCAPLSATVWKSLLRI